MFNSVLIVFPSARRERFSGLKVGTGAREKIVPLTYNCYTFTTLAKSKNFRSTGKIVDKRRISFSMEIFIKTRKRKCTLVLWYSVSL